MSIVEAAAHTQSELYAPRNVYKTEELLYTKLELLE